MSPFEIHEVHHLSERDAYDAYLIDYRNADGQQLLAFQVEPKARLDDEALKALKHEWTSLREVVTAPIFCAVPADNLEWQKHAQEFGFNATSSNTDFDDAPIKVYVSYRDISN